jgi:hypothetical protein
VEPVKLAVAQALPVALELELTTAEVLELTVLHML